MAERTGWFQGFSGINNINKSTRIGIAENGFIGLETADNIFITSGGLIDTIPDSDVKISGVFHSVWGLQDTFYCVKDDGSSTIYQGEVVDGELSMRTVFKGLTLGAEVSFTKHGDVVYYSNGIDNGYIDGTTRYAWPVQSNSRLPGLVAFTPGTHLASLAGRILLINDDEVRFTEAFLPGLYNDIKNRRRLNSAGRMICSVGDGAYVSDEDYVYFLRGINPNEWKLDKVLEYPAIAKGCYAELVDPGFFGFQTRQPAALFNTINGLCIGMASGEVYNLTEKRYRMDDEYDAISIFKDNLVILSNTSDGILIQGINEDTGNKAVTEWYGGFNSLFVDSDNNVVGANSSGLSLIWGQVDAATTGLEMVVDLEMLTTLEMV